jgi:AbrB family looped-hinge helix DNA binding protein
MTPQRAKVTSKGQITIPRDVRKLLGIRPGDSVLFESSDKGIQVRAEPKESPFAKYQGIGTPGIPPGRKAVVDYVRRLRGR